MLNYFTFTIANDLMEVSCVCYNKTFCLNFYKLKN